MGLNCHSSVSSARQTPVGTTTSAGTSRLCAPPGTFARRREALCGLEIAHRICSVELVDN